MEVSWGEQDDCNGFITGTVIRYGDFPTGETVGPDANSFIVSNCSLMGGNWMLAASTDPPTDPLQYGDSFILGGNVDLKHVEHF